LICDTGGRGRLKRRFQSVIVDVMDDAEIKRLRREIHRAFGSSPHKKKFWLALLEMYGGKGTVRNHGGKRAERRNEGAQVLAQFGGTADPSRKRSRNSGVGT
jgi:phage tail sheath gpL-like